MCYSRYNRYGSSGLMGVVIIKLSVIITLSLNIELEVKIQ